MRVAVIGESGGAGVGAVSNTAITAIVCAGNGNGGVQWIEGIMCFQMVLVLLKSDNGAQR